MTHKPAAIIRKDLGTLKEGALADIAVFDDEEEWVGDPRAAPQQGEELRLQEEDAEGEGGAYRRGRQGEVL
jgi:imidazolonepropionase-like amidohydrolase